VLSMKETQNNQIKHLKFSENKSAHKCIFCDKTHWENKCSNYNLLISGLNVLVRDIDPEIVINKVCVIYVKNS